LRNLIESGFLQPVDGSKWKKARRMGALKGHHTAPENFETKRTETLKGKPKTKAKETTTLAQDEMNAVYDYYCE
jgi:hypothetical protein